MSLIEIRNLRKEYSPDVVPLKGVNADIEAGEVISIIGPSGTGKSTPRAPIWPDCEKAWEWSFSPSISFPTKWQWKISCSPSRACWENLPGKPMRKP